MNGQEIKNALGQNIKNLRAHRKFSQAELAEKVDISIIYLSTIERGKKFPKPDIIAKIAIGLGVEVFELFKSSYVPKNTIHNEKILITHISEDITKKVIKVMETGFRKYLK